MAISRLIGQKLASVYAVPVTAGQTSQKLISTGQSMKSASKPVRREIDRRCGRDRRQANHATLIDLRCSHARRRNGRRGTEALGYVTGVDIYA